MLKDEIKRLVGPRGSDYARRLSRLRWLTKAGIIRNHGLAIGQHLPFVLWDPEVESYTYDIANVDELARFLADMLRSDVETVRPHLLAPANDPTFNEEWARQMRLRFDVKRRMMLANRLLWWGVARTLRPRFVVECGTYHGHGALVLLRALALNRAEGFPGTLLSVDADPTFGWAVPPGLTAGWERVEGRTTEVLAEAIGDREVDMLIHDTPHTEENARHEFTTALEHRGARLVLIDGGGGQTSALADLCARHGGRYGHFRERPLRHFYRPTGQGVGVFDG